MAGNGFRWGPFWEGVNRVLRGHGVVGQVTAAYMANMVPATVAALADGTSKTAVWLSSVSFVLYLAGALLFSYHRPETAAMRGRYLFELEMKRLGTKESALTEAEPTMRRPED